jgi:pantothenate kinase
MDVRAPDQRYNPYRIFSRQQWAELSRQVERKVLVSCLW